MTIIRQIGFIIIFLAVAAAAWVSRGELIDTGKWLLAVIGPTAPFICCLGAYVIVILVRAFVHAPQLNEGAILDALDHAGDIGEVAAISGLLGTILAMTTASINGRPDLAGFLQSLTSTLVGSGINALVMFTTSLMRAKLVRSSA